jgi:hypothetical protein
MPFIRLLLLLACASAFGGCQRFLRPKPPLSTAAQLEPLAPSPRLIVGRILAIDPDRSFALVDLASDAPAAALVEGAELVARTFELRETSRLRVSRYHRGHTLGTTIAAGQPSVGEEVVWLAP